jgi:hypothetical protein
MAKLSDETLTMTFQLLRQLAEAIELASATEWIFFERYGETPRTIGELEELQNARERLNQYNLFLDDAIAQIDSELRQQKRERLLQRVKSDK